MKCTRQDFLNDPNLTNDEKAEVIIHQTDGAVNFLTSYADSLKEKGRDMSSEERQETLKHYNALMDFADQYVEDRGSELMMLKSGVPQNPNLNDPFSEYVAYESIMGTAYEKDDSILRAIPIVRENSDVCYGSMPIKITQRGVEYLQDDDIDCTFVPAKVNMPIIIGSSTNPFGLFVPFNIHPDGSALLADVFSDIADAQARISNAAMLKVEEESPYFYSPANNNMSVRTLGRYVNDFK